MEAEDLTNFYVQMRPRKVCICRSVSEETIRNAILMGAHTFEEVQSATGCSTGCGTCESAVRDLVRKYKPAWGERS